MGILIFLVLLVVGGVMLVGVLGVGLMGATASANKKTAANPEPIIDGLFSGGEPQVIYTRSLGVGLTDDTLLAGAVKHGYSLTATTKDQYQDRMVFTRQSSLTT